MTGLVHVDAEKILRDAGIFRAKDEEGMEYFARSIEDEEGMETVVSAETDPAVKGYRAAENYNATLTHLETFFTTGMVPCMETGAGDTKCWQPKIPALDMPSLPAFYSQAINKRTGARYVWRDFYGVPIADRTTNNDAAFEYASQYFVLPAGELDFLGKYGVAIATVAVGAVAMAAAAAAEAGAALATEGALEAGALEAGVIESAGLDVIEATEILSEAEFAEITAESEFAIAESAPIAASPAEIVSAPVSSPVPPPSTGISLPSVSSLAKQAAPMLFKALAKPSAPSIPPRAAVTVPSAIGFSPYGTRFDQELTDGADNTMLYVAGAVGLAILAAVTLNAQRKG